MWRFVEYLKDPYLVVKVQNFYGIRALETSELEEDRASSKHCDCNDSKHKPSYDESCFQPSNFVKEEIVCQNGLVSRFKSKTCLSDNEDYFSSDSESESKNYVVTNWFWYYVFLFGTELGDEKFYATFIPFWFWNIDGAVGRRVVMVWTILMYIGQGMKDVVCWPRPASPPVFRLQEKWVHEYGMPSTHAMVGISIPFSVVIYTFNRYQYPLVIGLFIATVWCTVMCLSRIYLGMHSVLDIVVGLLLALLLMVPVVPLVDSLDYLILTSKWSPLLLIIISISLIAFYPAGNQGIRTPTRGDTTLIISVCVGVLIGAWTNYQLGEMSEPTTPPPYNVIWPSYGMLGLGVLRTVIGLCCFGGTRALCKSVLYAIFFYIENKQNKSDESKSNYNKSSMTDNGSDGRKRIFRDICQKYVIYLVLGFTILYLLPNVFRMLRIDRPTFYTEI